MGSHSFWVIVCCLLPLCLSQRGQNILYEGTKAGTLALTLVRPSPYNLTLLPLGFNNLNQLWSVNPDGTIESVSEPGNVISIAAQEDPTSDEFVGISPLDPKIGPTPYQQWIIPDRGPISPRLNQRLYLSPVITPYGGYIHLAPGPIVPIIQYPPATQAYTCQSTGDPHIIPFIPPSPFPTLNNKGVQTEGDFVLAIFGDTVVVEGQAVCGGGTVFCNYKTAVTNDGNSVVIIGDNVYIDANPIPTVILGITTVGTIVILRVGAGSYVVTVPEGSVTVVPNGTPGYPGIQDIYISVTGAQPPFYGLCGTDDGPYDCPQPDPIPIVLDPLEKFVQSWQISWDEDPFYFLYGSESNYLAANPCVGNFDFPVIIIDPSPHCGPILHAPVAQICAQNDGNDQQNTYQSCVFDVASTRADGFSASTIDGFFARCALTAPAGTDIVIPTSVPRSIVSGVGITGPVVPGQRTTFTIQALDALGNDIYTGGDDFSVSSTDDDVSFEIKDEQNGFYIVTYVVPKESRGLEISVVGNQGANNVLGSPFKVPVNQAL